MKEKIIAKKGSNEEKEILRDPSFYNAAEVEEDLKEEGFIGYTLIGRKVFNEKETKQTGNC